jgi:DNA-directed RNA polymerase subunit RPC12/RpoP
MANATTKKFTLPSLGKFYGDRLPGGTVEVRKMTISELSILEQGHIDVRMEEVIKRCSLLPDGLSPNELLSSDRMYLLFAIRSYSFSAQYMYDYKCPSCGARNDKVCDLLTDLTIKNPDENCVEPITVHLADAECSVDLRFLRGSDEEAIRKAKLTQLNTSEHILTLERQIIAKDGNPLTAAEKAIFVRQLTAADVIRIKNRLEALESGMSTNVKPVCVKCSEETEMGLPIGREFFRPSNL